MSIIGMLKTFSSLAAVAQPHVVKIIEYKRALTALEEENKRLKEENQTLKTQALTVLIFAIVFFIAFIIVLTLLFAK
ncbi:MAG: hypothetical protein LBQ47_03770 [Endomicrobium sp.]|jgi:hypothetical protein|nr:hypothetical protein [Endomicrobium sp.]